MEGLYVAGFFILLGLLIWFIRIITNPKLFDFTKYRVESPNIWYYEDGEDEKIRNYGE